MLFRSFDCDSSGALATIYRSVPVSEEAALATLGASAETVLRCEWKDLRLRAFERVMSGAFALKERQLAALPPDAVAAAVRGRIAAEGTGWLPWGDSSRSLLARARYAARMGRLAGAPPVLLPEEKLATMLEAALPPYIPSSGQGIGEEELCSCLRDLLALELGPGAAAALDREAPAAILTPGGRRRAPCYPEQGEARLSMRIQEAFGMTESPLICGVPLVLELLSPADRPLQLTKDLASFWRTAYPELRRELSRRYPRHHWPEDPLSAAPGKGLKPRA